MIFLIIYGFIGITWIFYLAFANLIENKDKLHPLGKVLMYPWLVVGILLDILFNITYGSIIFRELPREFLFTSRCQRHLKSSGRNLRIAAWHCEHLLDPFQEGGHC